uniref:Uncharacterized protein n=1 Tax=Chara braunii TaxID=69332 RepID=A0A388KAF9_CHABU
MGRRLCHRQSSTDLPSPWERGWRLWNSRSMAMLVVVMVTMITSMPAQVLAAVGADGSLTAERGRGSVLGTESAHHGDGIMRGARKLEADSSPAFSIRNTTLLQASRVVFTATDASACRTSDLLSCFRWVRRVVFTSETGVFYYLLEDSWRNSSSFDLHHAQSVHKGDLRGIASVGDAQANSSLLTLRWTTDDLNGTAASAAGTQGSEEAPPYFVGFDLSRDERNLVMPTDRGLAFVDTMDGSTTSYELPGFEVDFGAFNPNRTIFYVARDGCLDYSVMDGESPGSFANEFRSQACRAYGELTLSHQSFLQDGSYIYARGQSVYSEIIGINVVNRSMGLIAQTDVANMSKTLPGAWSFSDPTLAVTQDGCNLFFAADSDTNIGRMAFDKPRGKMVKMETVAECILPGGCLIRTLVLDNDDSHLYVSIQTGQLFEFSINKLALGRCSGALPTPAARTLNTSTHPSSQSSPASSRESPAPPSSPSSSSPLPAQPSDASAPAGSSSSSSPSSSETSREQSSASSPMQSPDASTESSPSSFLSQRLTDLSSSSSPAPVLSMDSSPSSWSSEPRTESSSSSQLPARSTDTSSASESSSSLGHDGSSTRVSSRFADTASTSLPANVQTPPREGVSLGVMAAVVVAACLVAAILGGAFVILVSRSRKSVLAGTGGSTATSSALERPVAPSSALERPLASSSALERPVESARIAVRARPAVPPRPKKLSRQTTPAASSTALTVQDATGDHPAYPVRGANEPATDYRGRLLPFSEAVAAVEARKETAEAGRQRLANEAAAETQRTTETDAATRDRRNASNTESLIACEHQWTTILQAMIFVPTEAQADPTPAEAERSNLANLLLGMMRGIMWNNTLLQSHLCTDATQRQTYKNDITTLTTAIRTEAIQQQQQHQLLNSTITRVNSIEANASAAPGCTTDVTKQLNERIDHVVTIIGDISTFNGPDSISSTVAAIKTDITKLQTRPEAATKTFKMPHFDISKFDDYNKSDALSWWQRFLTEAACLMVPADDMLKALYLQLIGGVQGWMNHLAATHKCTIAELHTHITWKELEQLWFTRFMVRNIVKAAMNEVYTCSQGNMPTRDWTTKWQKIVTTAGLI